MRKNARTTMLGVGAVAVAAALALAGCSGSGSAGAAGASDTLTVTEVSGIVGNAAVHLGVEKGFFADEGLTLKIRDVQNPPAGLAAVQGGQADIGYSPSTSVLTALSQGVGLKVVAAADGYAADALQQSDLEKYDDTSLFASAKSGVSSIAQLRGKTIAVPARKAQLEVVIANLLQSHGVAPSSVKWVTLDFQSALAALKNGTVDAAGLVDPFSAQAKAAGLTWLAAPSIEFFKKGAVGLWTTSTQAAKGKKKQIAAFQRALYKSNAYADAHLQEAKKMSISLTGAKITPSEVVNAYWPATIAHSDLQNVDDRLAELGYLPKPVDLSGVILRQP